METGKCYKSSLKKKKKSQLLNTYQYLTINRNPWHPDFAVKIPFLTKNKSENFGEMVGLRSETSNVQDEPRTSCHADEKEAIKDAGIVSIGLRSQFEKTPTDQRWVSLNFNNDNNCNQIHLNSLLCNDI